MEIKPKVTAIIASALFALLGLWLPCAGAVAASASAALLKAKQDAESRGYIFFTSREEILAKAKKEGRVRALTRGIVTSWHWRLDFP